MSRQSRSFAIATSPGGLAPCSLVCLAVRGASATMAGADLEAARTEPDYPEADRPWERPGAVRRDVEPHSGMLILALGGIAEFCGMLSWLGAVTAPLAIGAGVIAWLLARRDLALMRQRLKDPAGRRYTELGPTIGLSGAALGLFFGAVAMLHWLR
jgi:hypothetical protein